MGAARLCSQWIRKQGDWTTLVPWSLKQVVESYTGGKRKIYERAMESVMNCTFNKSWAKVRMFVKPDKYDICKIKQKVPRAIQYRKPEFNLLVAQYLRPIEEKFYNLKNGKGLRYVAKGRNLQQRASDIINIWESFRNPVIISIDHSKFDSCVRVEHLRALHRFYLSIFKSKHLYFILRHQLNNKGFSMQGLKYKVKGTRMSGDYDTALGNTLLNFFVIYSVLDRMDVDGHFYIDGDDGLIFIERAHLSKFQEHTHYFEWMGFETKISIDDLSTFEFCQTKLIRSSPPVLCRDPRKVVSNLCVSLRKYDSVTWPKIFQGKVICEYWANQGVPIVTEWLESLLVRGMPFVITTEDMRRWLMVKDHKIAKLTPSSLVDLYNAWGFGALEAQQLRTPLACGRGVLHKSGPAANTKKNEWTSQSMARIQAEARWLARTCGSGCGSGCRGAASEVVEPTECSSSGLRVCG